MDLVIKSMIKIIFKSNINIPKTVNGQTDKALVTKI